MRFRARPRRPRISRIYADKNKEARPIGSLSALIRAIRGSSLLWFRPKAGLSNPRLDLFWLRPNAALGKSAKSADKKCPFTCSTGPSRQDKKRFIRNCNKNRLEFGF